MNTRRKYHRAGFGLTMITALGIFALSHVAVESTAFAQQGVINLDETVIKGRIQKPEAFYILQHANLTYEKLSPKQSFVQELLKSVEEEPF